MRRFSPLFGMCPCMRKVWFCVLVSCVCADRQARGVRTQHTPHTTGRGLQTTHTGTHAHTHTHAPTCTRLDFLKQPLITRLLEDDDTQIFYVCVCVCVCVSMQIESGYAHRTRIHAIQHYGPYDYKGELSSVLLLMFTFLGQDSMSLGDQCRPTNDKNVALNQCVCVYGFALRRARQSSWPSVQTRRPGGRYVGPRSAL